ncbi:MAG: GNAT family N-acetyltransferase [Frankiaceae bacterium]
MHGHDAVGLLGVHQQKGTAFPAEMFDPHRVAPQLFERPRPARDYLLIGGTTDLVSDAAVSAELEGTAASAVVTELAEAAFAHAQARELVGAALYVRDDRVAGFVGPDAARRAAHIDDFSMLRVPGRDLAHYLASLDHSRRSVVKRDWRKLDEMMLRARCVTAASTVDEALPLILAVKDRHGGGDHPAFLRLRMEEWAAEPLGRRVAFVIRSLEGRLLAASFACHRGAVLEMHEVGLADGPETRHLAYVEVLVYAPLRYALEHGCSEIHLGLASPVPKRLRGASVTPVWAVG